MFSPGILVVTNPLIEQDIVVAEVTDDGSNAVLHMVWKEFINPYNEMDPSIISYYEFNVLIDQAYSAEWQQLWDWKIIPNNNITRDIWTQTVSGKMPCISDIH